MTLHFSINRESLAWEKEDEKKDLKQREKWRNQSKTKNKIYLHFQTKLEVRTFKIFDFEPSSLFPNIQILS